MSTISEAGLLEKLMSRGLTLEQEQEMVRQCVKDRPALLPSLMATLVSQKHHYRLKSEESAARRQALADSIQEQPWHPATFLGLAREQRAIVALGARRLCVGFAPAFDRAGLRRGHYVFLNAQTNLIVGAAAEFPRTGVVGEFSRLQGDGQAVVRGLSDEELIVDLADDLASELTQGDLVVYDRESHTAWGKATGRHRQSGLLEELPLDVSIEQLGGLDQIFWELATEVSLHLVHPELAAQYRLGASLGCLFCGPPGTGKTSLVRALAGYLRRARGVDLKAFSAPPGGHRSMWFGASERRIKDLFKEIKDLSKPEGAYSLLLWDDLDHLGSRDHGVSGEIDARLLPCFLQEIDSLKGTRVMLLGCTNREDLLDEALLRRFGRVFRIGRPNREQAREIFLRHLTADLPYCDHGAPREEVARRLVDEAVAAAYAPNGELATLATLTFRDGTRKPLLASEVMTGALIALVAEGAKRRGCFRELDGGPAGITSGDVSAVLARELDSVAARLKPGPALRTLLNLPGDLDVVRVEPNRAAGAPLRHEFLESA